LLADYGGYQLFEMEASRARGWEGSARVENVTRDNVIALNSELLDTSTAAVRALRAPVSPGPRRLHLVQFVGPIKPEWREALELSGVVVTGYLPHNAYLVYGEGAALIRMQEWASTAPYVQWEGSYLDRYKIHPRARGSEGKLPSTDCFAIQFVGDAEANAVSLSLIERLRLAPIQKQSRVLNYLNVIVRLPPERIGLVAGRPEVISIQLYPERRKLDERQDVIVRGDLSGNGPGGPGYLAWLASKGFSQAAFAASGFAVDVTDSGVDNGGTAPNHFGLYQLGATNLPSRLVYNRLEGTPNSSSTQEGCDGHGTLNAHIVAGFNDQGVGFPHTDAAGFHYDLGVCPFVKLGASVIFDPDKFTSPVYSDLQSGAYHDGARVSNNSWGAAVDGLYDVDAQEYDALVRDAQPSGSPFPTAGNQQMVLVFAAGNEGPNSQTLSTPGTAKNVITVGAAENVRSLSVANGGRDVLGTDGCGTRDVGADNANDIIDFSSRGPCADGRLKPDLVAPGTHITGGVAQSSPPPPASGVGNALACYSGSGICALPGGGAPGSTYNYFPSNQQFYTTSSGTSHSTPAVAGGCALIRQNFLNHALPPPGAAMTKALLINSARYLNGLYANDSLWSPNQGMGEINLGMAFDGTPNVLHDELSAEKFTASGQVRTIIGTVQDPAKPFRVTVAWTDSPGSTTGDAYNNDLDLTVTVGGNTYKGNVFNGQYSIPGGAADSRNNVESVFLPAGLSGNFEVVVTAANINSDGVPGEAPAMDQDFALVIYNASETIGPVITAENAVVMGESCNPTNNAVDPGETVTVSLALKNIGGTVISNLVATLQPGGGVTNPGPPQTYGALQPGGAPVSRPFTFTAQGNCGGSLTCRLNLQDATNLGEVTFSVPIGQVILLYTQGFDGVTLPALPAGWTTSASGAQSAWVSSGDESDSAPNSAFAAGNSSSGVSDLVSPSMMVIGNAAQLSFRHHYIFESGQDGGVLEMKIGGASFADVLSAGGTFVNGGYTHTLNGSAGNPLGGSQAWSGNSGGFVTTTVKLPAAAVGQSVQFRWRCATDLNNASIGWYVDDVVLSGRTCCGVDVSSPPLIQPTSANLMAESCAPGNSTADPGETVTFGLGLQNIGAGNASNLVATLLATNGVSAPSGPQTYGAMAAGSPQVFAPFTFTASGTCGGTINPTLRLQDGPRDLGTVSFSLSLGQFSTVFGETFDGVVTPDLPGGWSTSAANGQAPWTTVNGTSDSFPNSVYSPDPGGIGINELVSPSFILPASSVQLVFRHRFDLETSPSGSTAYDGGVLEIKIGAGAFTDIVDAGGSFLGGAYGQVVSSQFGNPLAGRAVWSGNSGGFMTTTVLLPPAAQGQSVQFRWRCGSDSSTGGGGWYVDTVSVSLRACCGEITAPVASFAADPLSGGKPLMVNFTDTSSGTITNRAWDFGNGATTNTTGTSVAATYSMTGTNTVSLTVSGPLGVNQLIRTNYIVVTNAVPMVVANGFTLATEGCADGAIDPGELVALTFSLKNLGTAGATNLVATLLASGGVWGPSGVQSYGALPPGAAASRAFSFVATGTCGATNTATLQLQDGAASLGTAVFKFVLGHFGAVSTQNFDSVTAPALPSGWVSSSGGAGVAWATTGDQKDTGVNSAYTPSVATYGVADLVSPVIAIPPGGGQLSFRHLYGLENGYDGGLLEIKIGGGAFTNIVYAGGSFATNGYNITLPAFTGNPLGGQPAWTGSTGPSFIPCVVNLPSAASGQNIQLRWRCGSDESTADFGWYVDTIAISAYGCCSNAPWIVTAPQTQVVAAGGTAVLMVEASGSAPLNYQWRFYGSNVAGATGSSLIRSNMQAAYTGPYYVLVNNPIGWATSSVATVSLISRPYLGSLQWTAGTFSFVLSGNTGVNYLVERSTNLVDWASLATVSNISGQFLVTDPTASNSVNRYYRARLVP